MVRRPGDGGKVKGDNDDLIGRLGSKSALSMQFTNQPYFATGVRALRIHPLHFIGYLDQHIIRRSTSNASPES